MIFDENLMKKLMERMSELEVQTKDKYELNGKRIPRVTEVLSAMLHEDSLMSWSNSLGWKRISYRAYMREASDKGTYSHLAIEKFLKNGFVNLNELNITSSTILETVKSCMDGFISWWNKLNSDHESVEVIFLEETMIHKYFGGTCDCLLKIDNKYWLIDFKTSNHMNYNYSLQLAAYRYLLKEIKNIDIAGCTILLLDKTNHDYKTYDLDLSNTEHVEFLDNCLQTFMLLVSAYKMRLYTNDKYHDIYGVEKYN